MGYAFDYIGEAIYCVIDQLGGFSGVCLPSQSDRNLPIML